MNIILSVDTLSSNSLLYNPIKESADLLYHLSVMWISCNVKPKDVWIELYKRKGISGLDEKKFFLIPNQEMN